MKKTLAQYVNICLTNKLTLEGCMKTPKQLPRSMAKCSTHKLQSDRYHDTRVYMH